MTQLSMPPVVRPVCDLPGSPVVRVAQRHRTPSSGSLPVPRRHACPTNVVMTAVSAAAALLALALITTPLDTRVAATIVLVWPVILAAHGCFVPRLLGDTFTGRATRVIRAGAALGLGSWLLALLIGSSAAPEVMAPATAAVTGSGLALAVLGPGRHHRTRVLLVGHSADVAWAATELHTRSDLAVVGACINDGSVDVAADYPVFYGVARAVTHSVDLDADVVVVLPGTDLLPAELRRLQWEAVTHGIGVCVGTGLLDVAPFRMSLTAGAGLGLVEVRPSSCTGVRRLVKESAERAAAALGLLLLSPVLLAVAALVHVDSPGPVLFRQQRVGRHGQLFTMHKFRTMSCLAEEERDSLAEHNDFDGVLFKIRSDPRVTRVGRLLRRYSLDELPQLWNVLVGHMALVGPRPALPEEVARYDPDPRHRLLVKPGLTGLWQVSGRSDLDWEQTVRLDLRYVDNWSLRLDAAIVCRTVRAVLGHRGAY